MHPMVPIDIANKTSEVNILEMKSHEVGLLSTEEDGEPVVHAYQKPLIQLCIESHHVVVFLDQTAKMPQATPILRRTEQAKWPCTFS